MTPMLITSVLAAAHVALAPPARKAKVETTTDPSAYVVVHNARPVPITVFVITKLGETELGTVPAHAIKPLALRARDAVQGTVDFILDPRGQADEETGLVPIKPGDEVRIDVSKRVRRNLDGWSQ